MPDLHDVVVTSPVGFHKYVEAMHAELEELRGTLTLLRDVLVWQTPVVGDEYAVTIRASGNTLQASYVGPDHANPGGLVFRVIPRRPRRGHDRI
jgi:hypothetical protein